MCSILLTLWQSPGLWWHWRWPLQIILGYVWVFFNRSSSLTWTELLDLRVGEMQRIVDPCQHVMSAEVVNGHRCGVHIHCHPLPAKKQQKKSEGSQFPSVCLRARAQKLWMDFGWQWGHGAKNDQNQITIFQTDYFTCLSVCRPLYANRHTPGVLIL